VSPLKRVIGALTGTVLLVGAAGASAAIEPGGGSSFASGTDGWQSAVNVCQPTQGAPGEACAAANEHDPAIGNPGGSLRSRLSVDIGFVLFDSDLVWQSPPFRVPGDPGAAVNGAELTYDRRFVPGDLTALAPQAELEVSVVDETAELQSELVEESLDEDDTEFETRTSEAPSGALTREHIHHIELRTSIQTTTTEGGVSGSSDVHYDNVALQTPDPPGNSRGVTFPRSPVPPAEMTALMLGLNLNRLAGDHDGGTQVPLEQCTILGTPGSDRMRGTTGNDVLCGLGGNDSISGQRARDVIDTGNGNDQPIGNKGGDMILGLRGRDLVRGRKGQDKIGGGAGKDRLYGQGNPDLLAARDGEKDLVHGGASHGDRARADGIDRVRKTE
jgi:Ca2+-binding RTX toxin-like protein